MATNTKESYAVATPTHPGGEVQPARAPRNPHHPTHTIHLGQVTGSGSSKTCVPVSSSTQQIEFNVGDAYLPVVLVPVQVVLVLVGVVQVVLVLVGVVQVQVLLVLVGVVGGGGWGLVGGGGVGVVQVLVVQVRVVQVLVARVLVVELVLVVLVQVVFLGPKH